MNCIEVQKLLSLYVDNMLESGQRAEIGAHLDECEACKQEYKELMGLVAMLNAIEDVPLPECFDRRLRAGFTGEKKQEALAQVLTQKKKSILWKRLSSMAAIFVIGIFSVVMYNHSSDVIPPNDEAMQSPPVVQMENSNETSRALKAEIVENGSYRAGAVAEDMGMAEGESEYTASEKQEYGGAPETADADKATRAAVPAENQVVQNPASAQPVASSSTAMNNPTRHLSAEGDAITTQALKLTDSAIADARDSVAIAYYLKLLEKELEHLNYEISNCAQNDEHAWIFNIEITSTDKEGKETIEARTYIGQDGSLWIKE